MVNEQFDKEILEICQKNRRNYPQILKARKNVHLWNYILSCTKILQDKEIEISYKYRVSTYVNWTLNHRVKFGVCKTCGREFLEEELQFDGDYPKYCSMDCMNKHPDHVKAVGDTLERRYGKRVPAQIFEFHRKMEDTCERLYGVRNCWQLQKTKDACKTPEAIAKKVKSLKKYNLEHHGVCWYVQSDEFKEKTKSTGGTSKEEKLIVDWLKSFLDENDVEVGTFKIIPPLQLDVYIPSKKIAIEFNGTYYHSIEHGTDVQYHLNKTKRCEEAGVHLIHIWEDDWIYRNDEVMTFIREAIDGTLDFDKHVTVKEDGLIEVDRSKFNRCAIPAGYEIICETEPNVITRSKKNLDKYKVPDCEKFILKKI